jgi:hypothetical protein
MRLLAALLVCLLGASVSAPHIASRGAALPHDAYIWQRLWTPQLVAAAHRSSDIVRAWRVLVAEADRSGRWVTVAVPWSEILATQRPIVAVIRIDGRLDEAGIPAVLEQISARIDRVSRQIADSPAGAALAAVEIDYDCPTSKLPVYTRLLAALRAQLPRSIALSITALPTWMSSKDLEALTSEVDEIVLQVHAVEDPRRGLFDSVRAERWVQAFSHRTKRPFRVALPAYDVRVTWRPDGRLASVESEVPLLLGRADGEMLGAAPAVVLGFLETLQRSAPSGLIGVAWFRLPTDTDARAWSPQTWRAVVQGTLPAPSLRAGLMPTGVFHVWNVVLSNDGLLDVPVPRQVRLDQACEMADGANGFQLAMATADAGSPLVLEATGAGRLRAHSKRVIGWARCSKPGSGLHVVP